MASPLEDLVMCAFEDLIQLSKVEEKEIEEELASEENEVDENALTKPDVTAMSNSELGVELRKRNIEPSGFRPENEKNLQVIIEEEYAKNLIKLKKEMAENKERLRKQAYTTKRRTLLETKLREEQKKLHEDSRLNFISSLIKQDSTSPQMRIPMCSISARAFAKNIYENRTLIALDISNLSLDDTAGSFLGRMLRKNQTLEKLEMQGNFFGPKTCLALADAFKYNTKLNHLNLSKNNLTKEGNDIENFILLCKSLCGENPIEVIKPNPAYLEAKKKEEEEAQEQEYEQSGYDEPPLEEGKEEKPVIPETITEYIKASIPSIETFNIHKCFVGEKVGHELINALKKNRKLLFVDCSYNDFTLQTQHKISMEIDQNFNNHYKHMETRQVEVKLRKQEEDERQWLTEKLHKEEEFRSWLEAEKQERIKNAIAVRQEELKQEKKKRLEEEKVEEERREKERLAKMEADAKKAAKAKKKGK